MPSVAVRILHPEADPGSGRLTRWLASARSELAEHQQGEFAAAGADDAAIVAGPPDDRSYGDRLRRLVAEVGSGGLIVLGSGSIPLATPADRRALVAAARADSRRALANNRYSADAVAISRIETLTAIPDLPGDNALPRWLDEVAGYEVDDLRRRWRLAVDIDGPIDLVLTGAGSGSIDLSLLESRVAAVRDVASDPRAEMLIAGRTSSATLAWLERHSAARTRAWVEERGLRAASRLAQGATPAASAKHTTSGPRQDRPPGSILGVLLDRDGPGSFGDHLATFADAAIVDTRVLLAHRVGAEEADWPPAEDRFASDLLLAEGVVDPWLRELTVSAAAAPIPILLGGHTLVGPGVRLVVAGTPGRSPWR